MNSIALKHIPTAVAGLLDEYHCTQHADNIAKTAWRDLTSSDLQAVVQTVDPDTATAYCVSCVHQLFLPETPDIALSYRWSATLGDIFDGLCSACNLEDTVWIDILFNGQNAELTPEAVLELTPERYQNARRHILLVTDTQDLAALLRRGWICFEIAVRMISDQPMVELVDPHRKACELYKSGRLRRDFFETMETFDPNDKVLIQEAIRQLFTRGEDSYLSGADPVENFDRGVGDFVHLTGGKLLVADLAEQSCWQRIEEEAWTLSQEMEDRGKFVDCLFVREHLHTALETLHGHEHLDVAKSLNNIGIVYDTQGEYDLALAKYEESVRIKVKLLGHEHPDVAGSLMGIGIVYDEQGEYDLALAKHEEALRINEKILGHEHPDVAASLSNLGLVYWKSGDLDKALEHHEKALAIEIKFKGDDHPRVFDLHVVCFRLRYRREIKVATLVVVGVVLVLVVLGVRRLCAAGSPEARK